MDLNIDGVVISETLYKEKDKLITILTGQYGKINVLARGVKNISSKNAAGVQLFCFSEFELIETKGRFVLKTANLHDGFFGIRSDMQKYFLACYLVDCTSHVATSNSDETGIYRLLLNTLYALSHKDENPDKIKAAFELRLMTECGFMPDFSACMNCSGEIDKNVRFSVTEGVVVCQDCLSKIKEVPFSFMIPFDVYLAMKYIAYSPLERYLLFKISDDSLLHLSLVCENYLLNQTERGYETLKIYKSLSKTFSNI